MHLTFQRSLQPGVRDPNGKLITGTEIDFLVPHQGHLYAGNCLWMETDPAVPKACQILVLDSPKGQWRVDHEFTVNSVMMRCSVLKEITFSTDGRGRAIAPVSLLLAVPDAKREPLKVFCRDDATGDWSPSVIGTAKGASIRAMGLHRDKVTRIERIFAGTNKGVMSGVYDPAAQGRIRWDKSAEAENPAGEHGMGFCNCNGLLYCATSRRIYQRTDGTAPAWEERLFLRERNQPRRHSRPDGRARSGRNGRGALVRRLAEGPPVGPGRRFQGNHRAGHARVPDGEAGPSSEGRPRRLQRLAALRDARHGRKALAVWL